MKWLFKKAYHCAQTWFDDFINGDAKLLGHRTKYTENWKSSKETGKGVTQSHYQAISVKMKLNY